MTYHETCKWLIRQYANVARYSRDLDVKEMCCERIEVLKEDSNCYHNPNKTV